MGLGRANGGQSVPRARRSGAGAAVLSVLSVGLLLAACGGDGDEDAVPSAGDEQVATDETTSSTSALRACSEERHVVAFDFAGMLTASQQDWTDWINGIAEPEPRAGGVEVIQAYRERGYEVLYVTTAPPNILIDDLPVPVAVEGWLQRHGYPLGQGTHVLGYTGQSDDPHAPVLSITEELLRLGSEGVQRDAGYTENADKAYAYASGGVDPSRIFMIGAEAGVAGTQAIPEDDLVAHAASLQGLAPVCAVG
jgi:hypothetical protein